MLSHMSHHLHERCPTHDSSWKTSIAFRGWTMNLLSLNCHVWLDRRDIGKIKLIGVMFWEPDESGPNPSYIVRASSPNLQTNDYRHYIDREVMQLQLIRPIYYRRYKAVERKLEIILLCVTDVLLHTALIQILKRFRSVTVWCPTPKPLHTRTINLYIYTL